MRKMFAWSVACIMTVVMTACGGGGASGGGGTSSGNEGLPPSIPTATVAGAAVDGLIQQGTVSVYNFANGVKGALLGTTTTDQVGHYNLTIQSESTPVLIEVTGGYYKEEASGTQVSLASDQHLTALLNFKTGTPITMAVTPWSHVATALALYNYSHGAPLSAAIDSANQRISTILGLNILTTIPVDVTDIANASATMTSALQYGFFSAGISEWTYLAVDPLSAHTKEFTSIAFAQSMYDDVLTDGLLDGQGSSGPLTFGSTPLNVDTYRHGIAQSMLIFSGKNQNNFSGITTSQLLTAARNYAYNTDAIWNQVSPINFSGPTVQVTAPPDKAWVRGTIAVHTAVSDVVGIASVSLRLDTSTISTTSANLPSPAFSLDTGGYGDGAHAISVSALNAAGASGEATIKVNFDNTPPTVAVTSVVYPGSGMTTAPNCTISGIASDAGAGVATVSVSLTDTQGGGASSTVIVPTNGTWSTTLLQHLSPAGGIGTATLLVTATDAVGNSTTLTKSVYTSQFAINGTPPVCVLQ